MKAVGIPILALHRLVGTDVMVGNLFPFCYRGLQFLIFFLVRQMIWVDKVSGGHATTAINHCAGQWSLFHCECEKRKKRQTKGTQRAHS